MARKSRKQTIAASPVKASDSFTPTAGYVRLSVEETKGKGDSVETQKKIILDFLEGHSELRLFDMYVDDGISGVTFERPAFKRMQEDIENGKIGCVVVKDISRLGRNAIDTGYYVTKYFPSRRIRFISINDNFDSTNGDVNLEFMLKTMLAESYAMDIGRKTRSTIRQQMKDGKFVGSRPPYGYADVIIGISLRSLATTGISPT